MQPNFLPVSPTCFPFFFFLVNFARSYYYSGSVMAGSPSDADRRDVICRAVTTNYDDQAKCDDVMNGM